ncbi:arrestin domain-containing protein 3-like [Dunckerocampus dactyliophorus]|uniref:arrestin domain-containing protein 3-like n=1 Tax=Dunckerocampus dactyliophorus TaxID=161453 RepID=UPI0024061BF6|nr:arrestin domain-containing protein 3-like [Dunckerocampus dactyliophorus]
MSPIKDLALIYEAPNEAGIFSGGEIVIGSVSFTLTKDTKVKSFKVKVKGEARVHWTDNTGDQRRSHNAHRKYFKDKEYLIAENAKDTELSKGVHSYKFKLKIPEGDWPSAFSGFHGKIVYTLEAWIYRSWRMPAFVQKELRFVTKYFPLPDQTMCPQTGSVSKKMSKGEVQMSATVDRRSCSPGETLSITAHISNMSSKNVAPKVSIQERIHYHTISSSEHSDLSVSKVVGNAIKPNSVESVSCQLKVPEKAYTVHNCEIISVQYYVKVYLDISFTIDPAVIFPLVIVPARVTGQTIAPHPAGAVGVPSNCDFPAPAFPFTAPALPVVPGPYGYPTPDLMQHGPTSGYNNAYPQPVASYGFASAVFPPSVVQPQAPFAPPFIQHGEQPPSHMPIFQPANSSKSDEL